LHEKVDVTIDVIEETLQADKRSNGAQEEVTQGIQDMSLALSSVMKAETDLFELFTIALFRVPEPKRPPFEELDNLLAEIHRARLRNTFLKHRISELKSNIQEIDSLKAVLSSVPIDENFEQIFQTSKEIKTNVESIQSLGNE